MRKLLFIITCIVSATFSINMISPQNQGLTREQLLRDIICKSEWKYYNCDMGDVPYINIMTIDEERCSIGQAVFSYDDLTDFEIECYADCLRHNYTEHIDIHQISRRDRAHSIRQCKDGYVLTGDMITDNGTTMQGYDYYRKYICRNGRWIVYGINYKHEDKEGLHRLFTFIDNFSIA